MTAIEPGLDRKKVIENSRLPGVAETAMLTHDIRTSLNGILGGLCTIDLSTLPEEARQQLERVHAASLVLASLVSQAIGDSPDISDAGTLGATTNLDEFQEFLCRRWEGAAAGRDVELVVDAEEGLPSALDCPAVNLSRMVGNLVSNAIRYTKSGSVHVKLSRAPKGGLDIVVRDTGPGVDESVLRAVSRPGFGDALHIDARNRLGLQIVKSLATELGGRFSLRNAAEGGTVAAIWLPERLFLWDHGATKPNLSESASFPALAGARVLLAEDNPTNQMVATQMLSALDAVVSVASDGVEALEVFSREQFDLVVVDIEMPRLSGIDVIRAIRTLPDVRSRIPIVALTAYAMQEHKERIANAGANGLISKPITGIAEFGRALARPYGAYNREDANSRYGSAGGRGSRSRSQHLRHACRRRRSGYESRTARSRARGSCRCKVGTKRFPGPDGSESRALSVSYPDFGRRRHRGQSRRLRLA